MDNSFKENSSLYSFIDESLVVDKNYYDKIKDEVTCLICCGLVNNPMMCDNCETHYCLQCIENWKKANGDSCPKQCPAPINVKKIIRSFKNLIDKILLKCKVCKENISLTYYPDHIKPCTEKNSYITCPFCKSCRINKEELELNESLDKNLIEAITSKKAKLDNNYMDFKSDCERNNKRLEDRVTILSQEYNETKLTLTEKIRSLKLENEKYMKESSGKSKDNINLMKQIEKLIAEEVRYFTKLFIEKTEGKIL